VVSEYAKYGAASDIQILVIDKTGATPGQNWQEQLKNIHWGEAKTLEDAWAALKDLVEGDSRQRAGRRSKQ